jgi:hypothetical protein
MVMVKPEGATVIERQVCNDVPLPNIHQAPLHFIGFNPFYRFGYVFRLIK